MVVSLIDKTLVVTNGDLRSEMVCDSREQAVMMYLSVCANLHAQGMLSDESKIYN